MEELRENQKTYREKLNKGIMYIEYIKKNGDLRKIYCTRNNKFIEEVGHNRVSFRQARIMNQEKKYPQQLYVFDLQEEDLRILNVGTIQKEFYFNSLDSVSIPEIVKRSEKQVNTPEEAETLLDNALNSTSLPEF